MISTSNVKKSSGSEIKNPLNFKVVDQKFTADEVLNAYFKGKEAVEQDLKDLINRGLQISSVSSNYLFEKLQNQMIKVDDMYLRFVTPNEFDTLVVISDKDYYNKDKRWNAYNYAREINNNIDDVLLNFSFIPNSEEIDNAIIASDGFIFKYEKQE